jgi:hypothetical protein
LAAVIVTIVTLVAGYVTFSVPEYLLNEVDKVIIKTLRGIMRLSKEVDLTTRDDRIDCLKAFMLAVTKKITWHKEITRRASFWSDYHRRA